MSGGVTTEVSTLRVAASMLGVRAGAEALRRAGAAGVQAGAGDEAATGDEEGGEQQTGWRDQSSC